MLAGGSHGLPSFPGTQVRGARGSRLSLMISLHRLPLIEQKTLDEWGTVSFMGIIAEIPLVARDKTA